MPNLTILQKSLSKFPKQSGKSLSQLSSNEEIFNESAPFYEDKLHQSGYPQKLKDNPVNTETHSKRNHKRNIIWFDPPFNRNGIAEESFKGRLYNHNLSFTNEFYKNDTELSNELWQIKMKNYTPKITWRIVRKCPPYNYNSRKCYLCLNEKLEIALYEGENLLNKKTSNLVLFIVSFNVYATPSFSQLCSLSVCLFFYTFYTFQFKFDYLAVLSF